MSHYARVFCSTLGNCSCDFGPESLAALVEAKDKDVLVVLGIRGSKPNPRFKDIDEVIRVQGKFPNLILVGAAGWTSCCQKKAVDIFLEPLADLPHSASLILADFAARLRCMRPHLKAGTVSLLLKGAFFRQLLDYRDKVNLPAVFEMVLNNSY